ncbi:replication factor C large subunit [Methanomassiliicoccus luminyensis]|uniref:replication factor C large subunit n=1 Tax=Methanomassiliicoccus luminyensis TaxID=1080712 RepID=UPI000373B596|nr:replication factor C large subunit [Methanomassiliicoccus luminyensis]
MSEDWTEVYRPRDLSEVVGNPKAVEQLKAWADAWEGGRPARKAAVLIGTPGTGKTSAALALAAEYKWDVVEMNASDQRNADAIRGIALRGALGQTFSSTGEFLSTKEGKLKLIILDEADNISGQEDRGGVPAMAELIRSTKQPVILIVNDWYSLSRKSSALKTETEQIKFATIRSVTVRGVLRKIARDRGVRISDRALELLAEKSKGDLRSAIRDLQAVATGVEEVNESSVMAVDSRDVEKNMNSALDDVLKHRDPAQARRSLGLVDETPDTKLLWIEENLPLVYRDRLDLYHGMDRAARASSFLGRVYRRQYFGFWSYASDLMSYGVCAAKQREYHGFMRYSFPQYLMRMSRSKSNRTLQTNIALKLGAETHLSAHQVRQDVLPYFRAIYQNDKDFRLRMTIDLQLEEDEVSYLMGDKVDSAVVKLVMNEVKKALEPKEAPKQGTAKAERSPEQKAAKPQPAPSQRTLF